MIFQVSFTKAGLILPQNSPILHSDCFYSTFEITILDSEGAILPILSLILLQFWNFSINLCMNFQYEVHSLTKYNINQKL